MKCILHKEYTLSKNDLGIGRWTKKSGAISIAILFLLSTLSTISIGATETSTGFVDAIPSSPAGTVDTMPCRIDLARAQEPVIQRHKVTTDELEQLRAKIGVYEPWRNYNTRIGPHGTGLAPPTRGGWQHMAEQLYIVDSITGGQPRASADNTQDQWFPPIGNQDGEGACVPFAVAYYEKTYQEAKEHGWDLSDVNWVGGYTGAPDKKQDKIMSPDFIYHQILAWSGGTDCGSWYADAMDLVYKIGCSSWQTMPYNPSDSTTWPSETAWREAPIYRGSTGYNLQWVTTDTAINNLKTFLSNNNLAVIAVNASWYGAMTSGDLWTIDNYSPTDTNHANTIVGYDDNFGPYTEESSTRYGAFKVANSWGTGPWGGGGGDNDGDGCYWISYETMKRVVEYYMFMDDRTGYDPEIMATFEISHPYRTQCNVSLGIGPTSSPYATKAFNDWNWRGRPASFPSHPIVFDVTEFSSSVPSVENQNFFICVQDGGNLSTGTVTNFTIEYYETTYNTSGNADAVSTSSDPPVSTVQNTGVYAETTLIIEQRPPVTDKHKVGPVYSDHWALICVSANDFDGGAQPEMDAFPAQGLQAYYTLKAHGYQDDHIILMLWHDDDGDPNIVGGNDTYITIYGGHNDLTGPPAEIGGPDQPPQIDLDHYTPISKTTLQQQFQTLAASVGASDDVLIYLVNHGSKTGGEVTYDFEQPGSPGVNGSEMHTWLSWIATNCSRVTFLTDFCHSGDFNTQVDTPALNNVIYVAAAGDGNLAWYWMDKTTWPAQPYAGSWFYHPFWERINGGWSIEQAYTHGCNHTPKAHLNNYTTVTEIQDPWLNGTVGDSDTYSPVGEEWVMPDTRIYLNTTEPADATYYRIWYNGTWSPWHTYTGPFTFSAHENCKHYLEWYSVKGDLVEAVHNETDYVDAPVTTKTHDGVFIHHYDPVNESRYLELYYQGMPVNPLDQISYQPFPEAGDIELRELYPSWDTWYYVEEWGDNCDDILTPGDTLVLWDYQEASKQTYAVEQVTVTLQLENMSNPQDEMYVEFQDDFNLIPVAMTAPWGTPWMQVHPSFGHMYTVADWLDNGDFQISYCDNILLLDMQTGQQTMWHVQNVTTDVVVTPEFWWERLCSNITLEDGRTCAMANQTIYWGWENESGVWHPAYQEDYYAGNYNITRFKYGRWWYTYTRPIHFEEECIHVLKYFAENTYNGWSGTTNGGTRLQYGTYTGYYYFECPSDHGDDIYSERFTMPYTGTLTTAYLNLYQPGSVNITGEGIDVIIWDDAGGYPGTELARINVPYDDLVWWTTELTVDLTSHGLSFNAGEEFHIGYTTVNQTAGNIVPIISDDGSGPNLSRSCTHIGGGWYTIYSQWGADYDFLIAADVQPAAVAYQEKLHIQEYRVDGTSPATDKHKQGNVTITDKWALICVSTNDFDSAYDADGFPAQGLQAYYTLKEHGYPDDHIILMLWHDDDTWIDIYPPAGTHNWLYGPDGVAGSADDPVIDYDHTTPITKTLLRQEIQTLAASIAPGDDVCIYLVDHGSKNASGIASYSFEGAGTDYTYPETVTSLEMKQWLTWIHDNLTTGTLTFLLDNCHSGDFIAQMNLPGTIHVAAAGNCNLAWYWPHATATHFAGSWFYHPFWERINAGWSIQQAYDWARQYEPGHTPPPPGTTIADIQDPWLIDNVGDADVNSPVNGETITEDTVIYLNATDAGSCTVGDCIIHYRVWSEGTGWGWNLTGLPNTNVSLTITGAGKHYLEWYAVDALGNTEPTHNETDIIPETNQPPAAGFTVEPASPTTTDTIYYNSTSTDSDGSIVNWTWQMGDTTILYGEQVTHGYTAPGTYHVTLTVMDDDGATDIAHDNVTVIVVPTVDFVRVAYATLNVMPDMNVSVDFCCAGYALAYNVTWGCLGLVNVSWSVTNSGSNASCVPSAGQMSVFRSGGLNGTAVWTADDGDGHVDTVTFSVQDPLFCCMYYRGWNLMTVPCSHTFMASSLGAAVPGCSIVAYWNATSSMFQSFLVGISPPGMDFAVQDGMGYFIYVANDTVFSQRGAAISGVNVSLAVGWNTIGWYNQTATNASSLGAAVDNCTIVAYWNATSSTFASFLVGISPPAMDFRIERGMGVFVYVTASSTWHGEG